MPASLVSAVPGKVIANVLILQQSLKTVYRPCLRVRESISRFCTSLFKSNGQRSELQNCQLSSLLFCEGIFLAAIASYVVLLCHVACLSVCTLLVTQAEERGQKGNGTNS